MAKLLVAYRHSPYTTANYLVSALRALGHDVRCFGPGHEGKPGRRADAFIWIEAGGGAPDWLDAYDPRDVPRAAWFLDSHSQPWHPEFAGRFDHVFVAQYMALERFDRPVTWLPVACDPEIHTPPAGIEPEHDVVFVGHLYSDHPLYERRRRLLRLLGERYNLGVYEGVYLQEMAAAMAKGRVIFNVSTQGDLNMRVFEGLCSGRPLVSDWVPEAAIDRLFEPWVDLLVYANAAELRERIDWLLENPGPAQMMAAHGRASVLARHTYRHRAQQMLQVMGLGGQRE